MSNEPTPVPLTPQARQRALDAVRAYVRDLLPLLRLSHWEIEVQDQPPQNEQADANCWTSNNCYVAKLRFSDRHFAATASEQRVTVVHELLHIVTSEWECACRDIIDGLDPTAQMWARERYERSMERAIDMLSRILAVALPLPKERE